MAHYNSPAVADERKRWRYAVLASCNGAPVVEYSSTDEFVTATGVPMTRNHRSAMAAAQTLQIGEITRETLVLDHGPWRYRVRLRRTK